MNRKLNSNGGPRKETWASGLNALPPLPDLDEGLYIHDPDFIPSKEVSVALPPGCPQSALEREILRRLLHAVKKGAIKRIEELASLCPKGFALEDETKRMLASALVGATQLQAVERALWLTDYVARPPTMEEFLSDTRFLGASLGGAGEGSGLWPAWQTVLINQFDLDSFAHNVVLTGGIGIGKTLVMVLLVLYRICLVAHLRDPRRFFGLSPDGSIFFVIMSVTKETVLATAWQQALRWMQSSPFFCHEAGFDPSRSYADLRVGLRSLASTCHRAQLVLSGGSQPQHLLGRDALVIAMDECNFRLEADPQAAAYKLFTDMRARMSSRFQLRSGFMPGLSVVASSAEDESAFTERIIQEIARASNPVAEVVIRRAIYRVRPGMSLKPWSFRVTYGLPNAEPRILSGAFSDDGQPIDHPAADCPFSQADKPETIPHGMTVEFVPGDYFDVFQRSPRRALQQLSGIAVGGTHRLFATLVDIEKCIQLSKSDGLGNPLRGRQISVSDEDQNQIWDALLHGAFVTQVSGGFGPKRYPDSLRFVHMDLATTGKAGLAICHLASAEAPVAGGQRGPALGVPVVVEFDLIMTLVPGRERHIAFDKIRTFLLWLRKECGYRFAKITADSFQSEYLLQTLASNRFVTEKLSVDRSPAAYYALRAGFEAGAIRLYQQEEFMTEASQLLEIDGKIDHPSGASKDTTDAVAGAYFNAITSEEARRLGVRNDPPVLLGIQPKGGNATPEDPFGFYTRIPPRPIRTFTV